MLLSASAGLAADLVSTSKSEQDFSNCAFVTNDCEVCAIDKDGKPQCSSTGIACVPTVKTCLILKKQ
jgi:hypothetical protein